MKESNVTRYIDRRERKKNKGMRICVEYVLRGRKIEKKSGDGGVARGEGGDPIM